VTLWNCSQQSEHHAVNHQGHRREPKRPCGVLRVPTGSAYRVSLSGNQEGGSAKRDSLSGLGKRVKRQVEETLDPRETVRAVVTGRGKEAAVLTDRRIIVASGSLVVGSSDAVLLSDVTRITSGLFALVITLANGDMYQCNFWPTPGNRHAANRFVQAFRSEQLAQ
jgi:hypothetical protein